MGPGAGNGKWSQAKSDGNSAMTRLHKVQSSLELLQHHLSYQQGQGTIDFDGCMSYFLSCGRRWVLMGPGAGKWSQGKSDGNSAVTRLHSVHTCLELLQHHLSYQQGPGTINFDSCMSYFLRCGRRWVLMGPQERWQVEPGQIRWQFGRDAALQCAHLFGTVATSSFIPTGTRDDQL